MDPLALARWQFGITTVYHYLFVPITIGLAIFVAAFETAWVRTRNAQYLRVTKFFGTLFLINFALGVVTGIVQEFQFGMNWSSYSRFVGDVFGAPLAMEALLAFFLESTFLGLWIFGWDKLSPRLHAACMWMVVLGTSISAYFILAANSFMQHPVGVTVRIDPTTGDPRAYLNDIWPVLFQKVEVVTFLHVWVAALLTASVLAVAVMSWFLLRRREVPLARRVLRVGLWVMLASAVGVVVSGDAQGKVMTEIQPMKMAAAEALWHSTDSASFSLFSIGTLDGSQETFAVRVPGVTSFMATGSTSGRVEGIDDLQARYVQQYGPGDYRPNIPVTYWMFRLMMGAGFLLALVAVVGLWLTRRGRTPTSPMVWKLAIWSVSGAFIGNAAGWIFTEMGRQPWTVVGLFRTADSVSPSVSAGMVLTSLIVFTAVYGALAAIEVTLLLRAIRRGPPPEDTVLAELGRRNPLRHDDSAGSPQLADRDGSSVDEDDDVLTHAY